MARSASLAALAVLAMLCGGAQAATPASNRTAAQADARGLLARLALPSGASSSLGEPAGDGGRLARPAVGPPATPNAVDLAAWWRVPGTPEAVAAYIDAHPPAGSKRVLTGAGVAGFQWPPRRGVLGTRWLIVGAVALADGSTGVRADAEVVWVTPRPAAERLPRSVDELRVDVRRSIGPTRWQGRSSVVLSPRRIRRTVRLLNALPLAQPGATSCPLDRGVRVRLAFYRGLSAEAVAIVDPGGCEDVTLKLRGRRQPPLTGAAFPGSGRSGAHPLIRQLERALGMRLSPR